MYAINLFYWHIYLEVDCYAGMWLVRCGRVFPTLDVVRLSQSCCGEGELMEQQGPRRK